MTFELRNGAECLRKDNDVVLAKWRGDEYVTWRVDAEGNAYWGHYFPGRLAGAVIDFEERCGRRPTDLDRIAIKWAAKLGWGFHPDTRGADYGPALSPDEVAEYDRDMDRFMSYASDPYATALSWMWAVGAEVRA